MEGGSNQSDEEWETVMSETRHVEQEFIDNLDKAQEHAEKALNCLYWKNGVKRSLWYRLSLGRAQSILMSLLVKELSRKGKG